MVNDAATVLASTMPRSSTNQMLKLKLVPHARSGTIWADGGVREAKRP